MEGSSAGYLTASTDQRTSRILFMALTDNAAVAIACCVVEFLTVSVTLFRLAFRLRIQRLWWEDVWAAVTTVCSLAYIVVDVMVYQDHDFGAVYVATWVYSYTFTSVIWSVRMSVLYSIIRVAPPSTLLRNFMRAMGVLFVASWTLLLVLKSLWCAKNSTFRPGHSACSLPHPMVILEVAADFIGDTILVAVSLRLLWKVKLPRRQRRMILLTFSSTAVMSATSLLHAICQLVYDENPVILIFTNVEFISCLVVCNLLVVVTYVYRVYKSPSGSDQETTSDDDDFTTPVSGQMTTRTAQSLTTVDLSVPGPSTVGPETTRYLDSFVSSSASV